MLICLTGVLLTGCASGRPIEISITPVSAVVFSGQAVTFTAEDNRGPDDIVWSVNGTPSGDSQVGSVDAGGNYNAPVVSQNTSVTITASSLRDPSKSASAMISIVASGQVSPTQNPQVAEYTFTAPPGSSAFIQFGTDTSYALKTWVLSAPTSGAPMTFLVAGMLPSTQYHMRAALQVSDGSEAYDTDHTFVTGAIPTNEIPAITVTVPPGMVPQPGVEMLDLTGGGGARHVAAMDLLGNMIWSYPFTATSADIVQPVRLLANGHLLVGISPTSSAPLSSTPLPAGTLDLVREIDLAGNTIHEISIETLNSLLPAAGFNLTLGVFHHDSIVLPNGHWIVLSNTLKPCASLPGCSGVTNVLGDVLVDLAPQSDGSFLPVWVWSAFDHLDVARAPLGQADWTHSNAILYSPSDGNLLLSIRHQSWIIKIDYSDGKGGGDVFWRLGYQGDFALMGGTEPTDWFYAQHLPTFTTSNTSGQFGLAIMDNGNGRKFPAGVSCGSAGAPPCNYSSAPVLDVDESAKTATLLFHYLPNEFSPWGGNAEQLANGNLEADFNAGTSTGFSDIYEVTQGNNPQIVLHLQTSAQNAYRGFRLPSLYPGVQW
jgi:arylsulfate sulfotransferase